MWKPHDKTQRVILWELTTIEPDGFYCVCGPVHGNGGRTRMGTPPKELIVTYFR